jgi:hypothetical protein
MTILLSNGPLMLRAPPPSAWPPRSCAPPHVFLLFSLNACVASRRSASDALMPKICPENCDEIVFTMASDACIFPDGRPTMCCSQARASSPQFAWCFFPLFLAPLRLRPRPLRDWYPLRCAGKRVNAGKAACVCVGLSVFCLFVWRGVLEQVMLMPLGKTDHHDDVA